MDRQELVKISVSSTKIKKSNFFVDKGGWLTYNRYSVWVSVRLICRFWDAGAFASGGGCDCQESLVLPSEEFQRRVPDGHTADSRVSSAAETGSVVLGFTSAVDG